MACRAITIRRRATQARLVGRSALTLRAWLAGFGLVLCAVVAVLLVRVDMVAVAVLLVVLAGVAAVDLVWVLHRKQRGEPG